jgi:hypothetical protein
MGTVFTLGRVLPVRLQLWFVRRLMGCRDAALAGGKFAGRAAAPTASRFGSVRLAGPSARLSIDLRPCCTSNIKLFVWRVAGTLAPRARTRKGGFARNGREHAGFRYSMHPTFTLYFAGALTHRFGRKV